MHAFHVRATRVRVTTQPRLNAYVNLIVQVRGGGLPTQEEVFGHSLHLNLVHIASCDLLAIAGLVYSTALFDRDLHGGVEIQVLKNLHQFHLKPLNGVGLDLDAHIQSDAQVTAHL